MICRNCGKNIPAESELCPECGAKIKKVSVFETPASSSSEAKQSSVFTTPKDFNKGNKKRSGCLIAVVILVIAIIIAAASIFIVARKRIKQQQEYVHQMEELLQDEDLDMNEIWDLMEDIHDHFPESDESDESKELYDKIQEYIKNHMKEQDIQMPEEYNEFFDIMNGLGEGDRDGDEMYEEFMEMFDLIVKQQTEKKSD